MIGFMLDWIQARRKALQEEGELLPAPPPSAPKPSLPEGHDCWKSPFPREVLWSKPIVPLEPCPACGHAIMVHTYTEPCPLCTHSVSLRALYSMFGSLYRKGRA